MMDKGYVCFLCVCMCICRLVLVRDAVVRRERQAAYVGQPSRRSLHHTPPHFIFLCYASLLTVCSSFTLLYTSAHTTPDVHISSLDEKRSKEVKKGIVTFMFKCPSIDAHLCFS